MHALYDFSSFEDAVDRSAGARLALAGGSDQPPPGPDGRSAEVIRFPLERVHPPGGERKDAPAAGDDPSAADAPPAETGALWAAWLSSVLSSPAAFGVGSER